MKICTNVSRTLDCKFVQENILERSRIIFRQKLSTKSNAPVQSGISESGTISIAIHHVYCPAVYESLITSPSITRKLMCCL